MRRTVATVTPPAAEPVSLAEAKAWLRIDGDADDPLIAALISAATDSAERHTRRSLVTRTLRLTLDTPRSGLNDSLGAGWHNLPATALDGGLPGVIDLPQGPAQSVASVTTYGTTNVSAPYAASNYTLNADGTRLSLNGGAAWPSPLRPYAATEILYVAGYGTPSAVPASIRTAILMLVAHLYETRGACDTDVPPACAAMLNKYRIMDSLAYG